VVFELVVPVVPGRVFTPVLVEPTPVAVPVVPVGVPVAVPVAVPPFCANAGAINVAVNRKVAKFLEVIPPLQTLW
jgi:hypothetical protein